MKSERNCDMGSVDEKDYWVPVHVRDYLTSLGYRLPLEAMEEHIRAWHEWLEASGAFYDYRDSDGFGRVYEVHRRSIHPAMRVCREWGSLLLNDKTQVVSESQECTEWLESFFTQTGFFPSAQATVVRAFGMGTGAWALWVDAGRKDVRIRRYDARMVIPLSWDEDRVTECAFVTRAFYRGQAVDQLQMHLLGGDGTAPSIASFSSAASSPDFSSLASPSQSSLSPSSNAAADAERGLRAASSPCIVDGAGLAAAVSHGNAWISSPSGNGASPSTSSPSLSKSEAGTAETAETFPTYRIVTVCFDEEGRKVEPEGICGEYDTGCPFPTFALVKPAVENTRVDMSPYGQSIFADAIDAMQAVDVAFDAMITEVDISKMRVFLSDVMFDREQDGKKKRVAIPFGRQDCTVFRKVMSSDDMIQEFAPALRTSSQVEAFRIALQMLGDLCGLGLTYFDFDSTGYVKTATEVSSDNSALMRNIARHEHVLEQSITGIARALLHIARGFGVSLPDEGDLKVMFDDSIITDTYQEKKQDLAEVGVTMTVAEFRQKWYGEDSATAEERAGKLSA